MPVRIGRPDQNYFQDASTILSISSIADGFKLIWLRDQALGLLARSGIGWDVDQFAKLDFREGASARVATIAGGSSVTGAAAAAAAQTSMNAAPGATNTYTVTYDGATGLYTFTKASGPDTFELDVESPSSGAESAWPDYGYTSEKTGATSYASDQAVYQSRKWFKFDLGAAKGVQLGAFRQHNLGATGTVNLQGNATDAFTAPSVDELLAGDAHLRIAYLSALQTYRYWRFLVDATQNADGFVELAIPFGGPYVSPSVSFRRGRSKRLEELSSVRVATTGAHYTHVRPQRDSHELGWQAISAADFAILDAVRGAASIGRNLFLTLDSADPVAKTVYGAFRSELDWEFVPEAAGERYNIRGWSFAEVLP